jgi:DNA-binding MarR family transcriptional regulator
LKDQLTDQLQEKTPLATKSTLPERMQRKRHPQVRRFLRLYVTEKGRQYLPEQTALVNEELRERLGGLGPEEVLELERMLEIVGEGVRS